MGTFNSTTLKRVRSQDLMIHIPQFETNIMNQNKNKKNIQKNIYFILVTAKENKNEYFGG